MKRPTREYTNHAVRYGSGLHEMGGADRRYWLGTVATKDGYVKVYAEDRYASFSFIHDGRRHGLTVREWNPTERGLVTVARRFVRDVVEGKV